MGNNIAIEFEHVSKQYRLGLVSTKTLSHDIRRFWITNVLGKEDPYLKIGETNDRASKGNSEYVWALRDIDFKVEQGDVVGIIGKNGAGKSTLLKLLSRVTGPTTGTIRAHGRIGSLLEVGTGFHGEMTGRENIFMNGAILGMSRAEIQSKLDEIIDFSGCERYIDTPVKRYSSGMTVRLGFAVAAFLEPEILVVDEVLAVGDAEFQKKAIGKMKDVSQGQGRTVLFVSHNMQSMLMLCNHGILLEKGMIKSMGNIANIVDQYINEEASKSQLEVHFAEKEKDPDIPTDYIRISNFKMLDAKTTSIHQGEKFKGRITVESQKDVPDVRFRVSVINMSGAPVSMSTMKEPLQIKKGESTFDFELDTSMLADGNYALTFALAINDTQVIDVVRKGFYFEIISNPQLVYNVDWQPQWFGNVSGFELKKIDGLS